MHPEFWHERWRSGQIGFHRTAVDPNLRDAWPRLELPAQSSVLVPLCGKSLDLLWLRDRGHPVTGVEISSIALEAFCLENGVPARRRIEPPFEIYEAPNLRLIQGDFFALTRALLGPIDAVYDRAAAVAFSEAGRERYVRHLATLLEPGTRMLLVAVEYPEKQMQGPPFPLDRDAVMRLYSRDFEIEPLQRTDTLAQEPRMRARGVTEWFESCYRLVRI